MQLIGQIRHNLTFHYNQSGMLIERAISDRAGRSDAQNILRDREETPTVNLFSPYPPETKLAAQEFFVILK